MRDLRSSVLALAGFLLLPSAAARAQKLDSDDLKFLREVRPLILRDEEAVYKKLGDRGDRLEFQKIFWARRDPDLGTPENEFRKRYLVDRAKADETYRVAGTPGASTDCGRVFILLGKPDDEQRRGSSPHSTPGDFDRPAGRQGLVAISDEVLYWIYKDRPGLHFPGGQAIIAFDHECRAGSDLAPQLDRIAAAKVVHPNIGYRIGQDGHLVRLADQLPR